MITTSSNSSGTGGTAATNSPGALASALLEVSFAAARGGYTTGRRSTPPFLPLFFFAAGAEALRRGPGKTKLNTEMSAGVVEWPWQKSWKVRARVPARVRQWQRGVSRMCAYCRNSENIIAVASVFACEGGQERTFEKCSSFFF